MLESSISTDTKSNNPIQPAVKTGFIQKYKLLVIFILVVAIAVTVISSVFIFGERNSKSLLTSEKPKSFSLTSSDKKSNEYLDLARKSSDKKTVALYYQRAFLALSTDYGLKPSSEKREFLKKLADYIKTNFSEETRQLSFDIPCREEECGAVFNYSDGLSGLKSDISSSSDLTQELKQHIIVGIENAASASGKNDKQSEIRYLASVYTNLDIEYQRTNDENIKALADKASTLVRELDPDYVFPIVKLNKL